MAHFKQNINPTSSFAKLNYVDGDGAVVIFLPPICGFSLYYEELAKKLSHPAFAFEYSLDIPNDAIEDTAEYFVRKLSELDNTGPFILCAQGFGSILAFAMTYALTETCIPHELMLLDGSPMLPGWYPAFECNNEKEAVMSAIKLVADGTTDFDSMSNKCASAEDLLIEIASNVTPKQLVQIWLELGANTQLNIRFYVSAVLAKVFGQASGCDELSSYAEDTE